MQAIAINPMLTIVSRWCHGISIPRKPPRSLEFARAHSSPTEPLGGPSASSIELQEDILCKSPIQETSLLANASQASWNFGGRNCHYVSIFSTLQPLGCVLYQAQYLVGVPTECYTVVSRQDKYRRLSDREEILHPSILVIFLRIFCSGGWRSFGAQISSVALTPRRRQHACRIPLSQLPQTWP